MNDFVFYVAGPWAEREFVRTVIQKLNDAGWQTNSRWADESNPDIDPDDPERDEKLREQAVRDVEDVISADGLIYVNTGHKSEGKATELGIAIATLKPIIIIGGRENNIFLNLSIPAQPTVEDAVEWLKGEGLSFLAWVQQKQIDHAIRLGALTIEDEDGVVEEVEYVSE